MGLPRWFIVETPIKVDDFNGNFRILNWRYVSTIFLAIFCGDVPLHRPKNRPKALQLVGTPNKSVPESWPLI